LALRDLLTAAVERVTEIWCDGEPTRDGLVRALAAGPDLVVISDGYENAPAGRTAEVLEAARRLGVATPVVQLSPVLSAEVAGVRTVADGVPALPVHRPDALELAWVRLLLDVDPPAAARALARLAASGLSEVTG
jgi:hypothetical protein